MVKSRPNMKKNGNNNEISDRVIPRLHLTVLTTRSETGH